MMNSKEIIKIIHDTLDKDYIDVCYIFGSFLTTRFDENSDIDIAVLGEVKLQDMLFLEGKLEECIGRKVDLVNIEELPYYIQLQIVSSNKKVIFKENQNTIRYLYEIEKWYKEEFPFWMKLQREQGFEVSNN